MHDQHRQYHRHDGKLHCFPNQILHSLKAHQGKDIYELFDTSALPQFTFENRRGSVTPEYAFTVDIVDEPGAISTLTCILSARGISICNIGINHNREQGEGALKIVFYDEAPCSRHGHS